MFDKTDSFEAWSLHRFLSQVYFLRFTVCGSVKNLISFVFHGFHRPHRPFVGMLRITFDKKNIEPYEI